MKILIAEDNQVSLKLLERTLGGAGFETLATTDGRQAWEALQSGSAPKLLILDWMMPEIDGLELCRRIRAVNTPAPPYIILLTARKEKEDILTAFEAGADDYITKPFDRDELLARIRVAQRLLEQQALLASLLDSIPDLIFYKNREGRYLGCNPAYADYVGRPRNEIIGACTADLLENEQARRYEERADEMMERGESRRREEASFYPDGRPVLLDKLVTPLLGPDKEVIGLLGISRDITERSRMEESRQLLATVVEQSSEAIMVTDISGTIEYVNPAYEQQTGYSAAEAVGQLPNLVKSGRHPKEMYYALWQTITSGKAWEGGFCNLRKDGTPYEADAIIFPIRDRNGRTTHYVGILHDTTRERLLEAQVQQAEKMNAIGQLAGGVAHDFNNLLMVIRNSAQFIKDDLPEESLAQEDVAAIIDASKRAATLTRQLLAFSRKQVLAPKPADMNRIIRSMEKMLRRLISENINISLQLSETPCISKVDAGQLEQVLVNMSINAKDALPAGGVLSIETQARQPLRHQATDFVEVEDPQGLYSVISISDNGIGMAPETRSHIFEPFFTTKEVGKGTGLGLSTVYGIIKQHGGHITCYSEPGEGTTFKVYLPSIAEPAGGDLRKDDSARLPGGTETILLVEDEPFVLNLSVRMLSQLGYTVIKASNGNEALEQLEKHAGQMDLIFSDIVMPGMDGTALAQKVRELYPNIRILFSSGYSEFHIKERGLLEENANLLQKPFVLHDLALKIREILDAPRNTR